MSTEDSRELEALFEAEAAKAGGQAIVPQAPSVHPSVATGLASRWREVYANKLTVTEFKHLAEDTLKFLDEVAAGLPK